MVAPANFEDCDHPIVWRNKRGAFQALLSGGSLSSYSSSREPEHSPPMVVGFDWDLPTTTDQEAFFLLPSSIILAPMALSMVQILRLTSPLSGRSKWGDRH